MASRGSRISGNFGKTSYLYLKKNNKNRATAYVKGRSRKEAGLGTLESLYIFLKIIVEVDAPTFEIT